MFDENLCEIISLENSYCFTHDLYAIFIDFIIFELSIFTQIYSLKKGYVNVVDNDVLLCCYSTYPIIPPVKMLNPRAKNFSQQDGNKFPTLNR